MGFATGRPTISNELDYIENLEKSSFNNFNDIRLNAVAYVNTLSDDRKIKVYDELNRGVIPLNTNEHLAMYIHSFGKMHFEKLTYAFDKFPFEKILNMPLELIDYGAGQAIAEIAFFDYCQSKGLNLNVKQITLIEPSKFAIERSNLYCKKFYPDAKIILVNKYIDDLENDDFELIKDTLKIHLLSNILDIENFSLLKFSELIQSNLTGENEFICVGPNLKTERLDEFVSLMRSQLYFSEDIDKSQFKEDKDWTCSIRMFSYSESFKRKLIAELCDTGYKYAVGYSVRYDAEKSFIAYLQAAMLGDEFAQFQIGLRYFMGQGVKKNYSEATKWYEKSSKQGNLTAMLYLGDVYNNGNNVFQADKLLAQKLYKKGKNILLQKAKDGDVKSQLDAADMYRYGRYGECIDIEKAIKWFIKAAKQSDLRATKELGSIYDTLNNPSKSFYWKSIAVSLGSDNRGAAQFNLGRMYFYGIQTEIDYKKAFSLFTEANELNNDEAKYFLSIMYQEGLGVHQDFFESIRLLKEIYIYGLDANYRLAELYYKTKDFNKSLEASKYVHTKNKTGTLDKYILNFNIANYNLDALIFKCYIQLYIWHISISMLIATFLFWKLI